MIKERDNRSAMRCDDALQPRLQHGRTVTVTLKHKAVSPP